MARAGVKVIHHRNGVVEFDDPDTGNHVVILDGMTVESSECEAVAVVSVAAIVSCSSCSRRRIMPVAEYRHGWDTCDHCASRMYLPPLEQRPDGS